MTHAPTDETTASALQHSGSTRRIRPLATLVDLVRGLLIGVAEVVPGVSGGTVALVTGVYESLIDAASACVEAARRLVLGPHRLGGAGEALRGQDWRLVLTLLVGMGTAVATVAGPMESFVSGEPELARGLFFGLVAVSIVVPLRMIPAPRRLAWQDLAAVVAAAVVAFGLVGLAAGSDLTTDQPPWWLVLGAAAVAICALVVPGVSGSFFLLAIGLYTVTLTAIDERDLGYLALFAVGAMLGLASFVQVIRWLLVRRRRVTLLVMSGLMIGSLRALWPWQTPSAGTTAEPGSGPGLLALPYDPVVGPLSMALAGAALVTVAGLVQARLAHRTPRDELPSRAAVTD